MIYNVDIRSGSFSQEGNTLTSMGAVGVSNANSASSDLSFNKLAFAAYGGLLYTLVYAKPRLIILLFMLLFTIVNVNKLYHAL